MSGLIELLFGKLPHWVGYAYAAAMGIYAFASSAHDSVA